jgi:hypothetical protein
MSDESDQHRDKRQRLESPTQDTTETMELDPASHPTNHDRNVAVKQEQGLTPNALTTEDSQIDSHNSSLDDLQKDMGDAFLLGRSSKALLLLSYQSFILLM